METLPSLSISNTYATVNQTISGLSQHLSAPIVESDLIIVGRRVSFTLQEKGSIVISVVTANFVFLWKLCQYLHWLYWRRKNVLQIWLPNTPLFLSKLWISWIDIDSHSLVNGENFIISKSTNLPHDWKSLRWFFYLLPVNPLLSKSPLERLCLEIFNSSKDSNIKFIFI